MLHITAYARDTFWRIDIVPEYQAILWHIFAKSTECIVFINRIVIYFHRLFDQI